MRPLPDFLNPNLASCKRLTRVLAAMDPHLFCVWNSRSHRFEVYGASKTEGFAFLTAVEDPQGRPCNPEIYPMHILADLRARDRDPNMREILEHNAKVAEKAWHSAMDEIGEEAAYVAKAVAQESIGALRHGVLDVFVGLRNAREGRSKREPVERRIFVPGR